MGKEQSLEQDDRAGELQQTTAAVTPGSLLSAQLSAIEISRIVEMAWEDRTSFDAIERAYRLNEAAVIRLMRREISSAAFRRWRRRVSGRATKHDALRPKNVSRHQASTHNKANR